MSFLRQLWYAVAWSDEVDCPHRYAPLSKGKIEQYGIRYFFFNSRNYKVLDAEYNAQSAAGLRRAFEKEDKPLIEAQQSRIGDAGSTRARRIYERMLQGEAGAGAR